MSCEVMTVIGAGPSGVAAALAAAEQGASVLLVDENAVAGGSIDPAMKRFKDWLVRMAKA